MAESNTKKKPGEIYDGRMSRFRFILFGPLAFVFPFVVYFVVAKMADFEHSSFEGGYPIMTLATALTLVSYLVLTSIPVARRLNDAGRDRGFVCLLLFPGFNVLLLLYLMFAPTAKTHAVNTTTQQN